MFRHECALLQARAAIERFIAIARWLTSAKRHMSGAKYLGRVGGYPGTYLGTLDLCFNFANCLLDVFSASFFASFLLRGFFLVFHIGWLVLMHRHVNVITVSLPSTSIVGLFAVLFTYLLPTSLGKGGR